jgi:hypothetical protein
LDINGISYLIETEFNVIKMEKNIICVAQSGELDYPESAVKLTLNKENNHYELLEVCRGKEYIVEVFSDKYKSIIALYVFAKSKLEVRKYDIEGQNQIRQATTLYDIQKILKTFSDEQYYSFFTLKPNRIIVEKSTHDRYNVLFLGKSDVKIYIVKSRSLNSAAIVLYNFSFKLCHFYDSIDKTGVKNDPDFIETLKALYFLG